jgi:HK97 family phage prohead protease
MKTAALKIKRVPEKVVHKTVVSEETKGLEFILSDATPDRYDDIIMTAGWELANFKKNPIALFAHSGSFPIGKWKSVRIEDNALRGTLDLAPEGTSDRIDEIRRLVDAGILKAVSVGFTPIAYEERKGDTYGLVYTEQELVECSLVSVPANPNALQVAKELKISAGTQELVFGEHANKKTKILASKNLSRVRRDELIQQEIFKRNRWLDENAKMKDVKTDVVIKEIRRLEQKRKDLWTF